MPAPWTLAEYKELGEDLPRRMVAMAEGQQAHDHEMEKTDLAAADPSGGPPSR